MLLAGDLGGTKTLLGLQPHQARPRPQAVREFATLEFPGLETMIETFLADAAVRAASIRAAVVGVAGPVRDQCAELTNVPWRVSAPEVSARAGLDRVVLLNDVEAMAHCVDALGQDERRVLQAGTRRPDGNGALLSIGTGAGQAILHRVDGRFMPVPSEGDTRTSPRERSAR